MRSGFWDHFLVLICGPPKPCRSSVGGRSGTNYSLVRSLAVRISGPENGPQMWTAESCFFVPDLRFLRGGVLGDVGLTRTPICFCTWKGGKGPGVCPGLQMYDR
jgi:hypothetical protein